MSGRLRRLSAAAALGLTGWLALHGLAACGEEREPFDARIVYEASHPALDALLAAEATPDDEQGAHLLEPAAGAVMDAATPFTFRWRVGPAEQAAAPRVTPPAPAGFIQPAHALRPSALAGLIGRAHAHGPPISGRGYYLTATDEAGVVRYQLWTTALEHTPEGSDWAHLTEAGGTITVTITNAVFTHDAIAEGGGPWVGPSASFSF